VDKPLRAHGLLQAYSRTNRILNSVKTYGNIVSFRDLEQATNDAIALFGNKEACGIVLLKPFANYLGDYQAKVAELLGSFPLGQPIVGEAAQIEFIKLFGTILQLQNILASFDDFAGQEQLTERQIQDYRSIYLDLYEQFRQDRAAEKERIEQDVIFEIELIKQVEINVDYILMLVQQHRELHGDGEDIELRAEIDRAVQASPTLRNKRDLVEAFVASLSVDAQVDQEWTAFITARREAELETIIAEETLRPDETRAFVESAFRNGQLATGGTDITSILPPASRFAAGGGDHAARKQRVINKLTAFLDRFLGLSDQNGD
ncbi:MAG: type I restriction endonuclease subunit R, partial [Bifidobacteriaceae bacterium]|jgi:type I restriction enzyme R subunit|nr:type I restriction endonuclease subunit R [Bifidobacteriaceae bacterium]